MDGGSHDFQAVHDTFQPRILRYLSRLVGDSDAEDLAQEVFLKVSRALPAFRGDAQLSTWIYRVATNAAIDRMRSASSRQAATQVPVEDPLDMLESAEASSVEDHLMRKERYECFGRFVAALPMSYRSVVLLSEVEELTDREIADVLGLSLEAVKIRLHRGRARLMQELKANCKAEDWL